MIFLAIVVTQLADLVTWAIMGSHREINPVVVDLTANGTWMPIVAKVALVVAVVSLAWVLPIVAQRAHRWTRRTISVVQPMLLGLSVVVGAVGATSNVWTVIA